MKHMKKLLEMLNSEGGTIVDLQKTLNDVYPSILSAVFVIICWYLLSKQWPF